jgi:predicted dehydrogenase
MDRLRMAVIGYGYWGPNIVRTFAELPDVELVAVADRDPRRLEQVHSRHPQVPHLELDHRRLFELEIDAVAVATPPQTHHHVVTECLDHGLDVMVEKPLAISTVDARDLVDRAEAADRILMVGHIGAYHPAVQHLRDMRDAGELGPLRYIDAVRAGLGLYHPSLNVIWDLAPHDIAIISFLLGESPDSVSARGVACVQAAVEDVAYLTFTYPCGVLAHIRMSWLDPCKTRRITLVGSSLMAVYDDLEPHEKVKVYDKRVDALRPTDTFSDFQYAYHYGSVVSPYIQFDEPLRLECSHFVESVRDRTRPLTDGWNGLEVVEAIEAAQRSLRAGGVQLPVRSPVSQHPAVGRHDAGVAREAALVAPLGAEPVPSGATDVTVIDVTETGATHER